LPLDEAPPASVHRARGKGSDGKWIPDRAD
jgi:hypothetical protein